MGLKATSLFAMPNNDQLSFDDMAIFLAVAEAGGFRTAAKRLGLSPSTVSEKIAAVESRLRTPLLVRTTRSVMPTEAGRALAARLAPLFAEARAAIQDAGDPRREVQGLLKLNVTGAVMIDILPPLIERLVARHPLVRVELVVEDQLVDMVAQGCDAGVRYGEHLAQDMIAVPLGPRDQYAALGASPGYLAKFGCPQHPHDLLKHDCIRLRYSSGALISWDLERDGETVTVDPPGRLVVGVDGAQAAIDFACGGLGIISTFGNWLAPHFATARLKPVLRDWWQPFEGPWLYFSSRLTTPPLRALLGLLNDERRVADANILLSSSRELEQVATLGRGPLD